jgi:Uncharacterized alpha/beta hydrolase domain (DUF2235)
MPTQRSQENLEILAQMGIRKGSRIGPLLLLLLVAVLFIVLSLQDGLEQLVSNLGLQAPPNASRKELKELLNTSKWDKATEAFARSDWNFLIGKIGLPIAKAFLEDLVVDFWGIAKSMFHATWQMILYSLVPGLAGLIYRKSFWAWFLVSFAVLLAINASGLFGSLSAQSSVPESTDIFLFVALNLVVLLLANRLRRHSSSISFAPAWLHNGMLAVILVLFAIAWGRGWGPWSPSTNEWMWSFLPTSLLYKWETILVGLPIVYILFRKSTYWPDPSPKNIVVCIDGTSNTPDQYELGLLAQTNVFKLFKMLKADKQRGTIRKGLFDATLFKRYANRQIAFYYSGVGNKFDNDPILQYLGLATGAGASGIVERAYLDVMRVYRKGDRIYIFGFSRGAAIARLLARTIDSRDAPKTIWTLRLFGRHWLVRRSGAKHDVPISVLGCWDTVGSFGIAKTIAGINFQQLNLFKDLAVPDNVEQAYHMLALDETRDSFEPTLMEPDPITPSRIIEVWFSGDHANVGGGWATDKLSDVTLDFLLRHVSSGYAKDATTVPGEEGWGLYLKAVNGDKVDLKPVKKGDKEEPNEHADAVVIHPDPLGQVRQMSSMLYRYAPRKLPLHAVISETVFERMTKSPQVYAPESLFVHHEELDKRRQTVDTQVSRLVETKSLDPEERKAIIGFKDKLHLTRWPQYVEELRRLYSPDEPSKRLANQAFTTPLI